MDLEEDIKSEELDNITGSRLVRVKREVREAKKKLRDKVTRVEVPDRMERLLLAGTEPKPDRENNLHKENSEWVILNYNPISDRENKMIFSLCYTTGGVSGNPDKMETLKWDEISS